MNIDRTIASMNIRGNDFTAPEVSAALEAILQSNPVLSLVEIETNLLMASLRRKFDTLGKVRTAKARREDLLARITNDDDVASMTEILASSIDTWSLLDDGGTLLHFAIQRKAPRIVQRLLKEPGVIARIQWMNSKGLTPLALACKLQRQDIIRALIVEGGAPIDSLETQRVIKMKDLLLLILCEMCKHHDAASSAFAKQLFVHPTISSHQVSSEWSDFLKKCAQSPPEPPKELKLPLQSLAANQCLAALDRCDSRAAEGNRNAQILYGICALMLGATSDRSDAYLRESHKAHPMLWAASSLYQPLMSLSPSHRFSAAICVLLCDCSSYPRAWRHLAEDIVASMLDRSIPSQVPVSNQSMSTGRTLTVEERFEEIKRKYPAQAGPLIDLMKMTGLRSVKEKMFALFDELEVLKLQSSTRRKNMNARFEGNPGTGKTTVVDFYAKILQSTGVLSPRGLIERTTGTKLKVQGMMSLQDTLKKMKDAGGGMDSILARPDARE